MPMETKEEAEALLGLVLDGKYRLEALIGRGGFGVVYRARHLIWDQLVAIKVLTKLTNVGEETRDEVLGFFVREGRLLSALSSRTTGIVQARDIGTLVTETGLWMPYMVLEWLDGEPLGRILKRERFAGGATRSAEEVFQIFDGVARALAVAHAHNVAHRDIKPPNIVVVGRSLAPGVVIKLLDFGIAKVMQAHSNESLEMTGSQQSMFTPYYGAPEQFNRGLGGSGPWSDVFAMALVIVEVMIGRRVLSGQSYSELSTMCLDPETRPTPRAFGAEVDDAVEAVFARALAIRPEDRFSNMGEFWLALVDALEIDGYPPLSLEVVADVSGISSTLDWANASVSQPRPEDSLGSLRALDSQAHELGISRTGPPSASSSRPVTEEPPKRRVAMFFGAGAMVCGAGLAYLNFAGDDRDGAVKASDVLEDEGSGEGSGEGMGEVAVEPPAPCPEGMVKIEGSSFFMGTDDVDVPVLALARPAHKVEVADFCLDRTEVTVAAFRAFSEVGESKRAFTDSFWPQGSADKREWQRQREALSPLCNGVEPERDEHPVNCVTWSQADEHCRLAGKRLPSEAEWEYAARGRDGRIFPWGDEPPTAERVNGCGIECSAWQEEAGLDVTPRLYEGDDGYFGTSPVGAFPKGATEAGLVDIIGNVFEWTADAYRPYDDESEADPSRRVIRGGAFNSFQPEHANPALRYPMAAEAHSHGIGFRCAAAVLDGGEGAAESEGPAAGAEAEAG